MTLAIRFAIAAITAFSFAAVPVYPGAVLDVAASKAETAKHPDYPYKVYGTADGYDKVVAFYSSKGASQQKAMSVGNTANQKMAMFAASDSTIAINWPVDVVDKSGKVMSHTGTRIAIGK